MYPVHDMDYIYERSSVDETTGCWIWQRGFERGGYGLLRKQVDGRRESKAHRYSFYLYYGYLPLYACHKCNNKKCVNPHHLYNGDAQTNSDDRVAAGHQIRGSAQHLSKITEDQAAQIRDLYKTGNYYQQELANMFGVNQSTISSIVRGATWSHLE